MENTNKSAVILEEARENSKVLDSKILDSKKAMSIEIVRHPKNGLQIFLQSDLDWSFLRAQEKNGFKNIGKVQCYYPRSERIDDVPGYFYTEGWEYDSYPNLWLLLAKDLEKGVVFNFGLTPVSKDKLITWIAKFKQQIKALYFTYMKPINISVDITTQTVERDCHD